MGFSDSTDPIGQLPVGFSASPTSPNKPLPVVPLAVGGGAMLMVAVIIGVVFVLIPLDGEPEPQPQPPVAEALQPLQPRERVLDRAQPQDTLSEEERKRREEQALNRRRVAEYARFINFRPEAPAPFQLAQVASPAPLSDWGVRPDPPIAGSVFTPKAGLRVPIGTADAGDINRPDLPSPFLLLANESGRGRSRVIDLRRGVEAWDARHALDYKGRPGLTPDGKRMVFLAEEGRGKTVMRVIEHSSRAKAISFPIMDTDSRIDDAQRPIVYSNDSAAVLAYNTATRKHCLAAFDLKTGRRLWEIADYPAKRFQEAGWGSAVSPGGGYLAFPVYERRNMWIGIARTSDGKIVGKLRSGNTDRMESFDELGFSPDGSRLFAVGQNADTVAVWELATGRLKAWSEPKLHRNTRHLTESPACAMLDNAFTIAVGPGEWVVDARTGEAVSSFYRQRASLGHPTKQPSQHFDRHLGNGNYLAIESEYVPTAPRPMNTLIVERYDPKHFEDVARIIDHGGAPIEIGLPLLTDYYVGEYKGVSRLNFAINPEERDPWPLTITQDAVPRPGQAQPVSIEMPFEAYTPPRRSGYKWMVRPSRNQKTLISGPDQSCWLVDLTGQAPPRKLGQAGQHTPVSISSDGELGLLKAGRNRFDVVDLTDFSVLHSARVCAVDAEKRVIHDPVEGGLLVGQDKLWFNNGLIDLGKQRLLFRGGHGGIHSDMSAPTDDGKYILVASPRSLDLVDAQTAEGVARLDVGGGMVRSCAISTTGRRTAAMLISGGAWFLVVHDLRTGLPVGRFTVPTGPDGRTVMATRVIGWVDDRLVLIGSNETNAYVADSDTGRLLWGYHWQAPSRLVAIDGGRAWSLKHDRASMIATLYAQPLPHPAALAAINNADAKAYPAKNRIEPGPVRLVMDGLREPAPQAADGPSYRPRHRGRDAHNLGGPALRSSLVHALEREGFSLNDQAPVTLRVSMTARQEPVTYRHGRSPRAVLNVVVDTYTIEWIDAKGNTAWSRQIELGEMDGGFNAGSDMSQAQVQADYDRSILGRCISELQFPSTVASDVSLQMLGSSLVTERAVIDYAP